MPTAATAPTNASTPLPLRNDTFLGVCEAIGQDLGINPNWLRVAFAPFILVSPLITLGVYLALGAAVAASRWLFPAQSKAQSAAAEPESVQAQDAVEERLAA